MIGHTKGDIFVGKYLEIILDRGDGRKKDIDDISRQIFSRNFVRIW